MACIDAPAQYQQLCYDADAFMDSKIVQWTPITYTPLKFVVEHFALAGSLIREDIETDNMFFNAMMELNPDIFSFSIIPQMYDTGKPGYDNAVTLCRANNKEIIFAYHVGGGLALPFPTFDHIPTISEYITKEKTYLGYYISNYNPEYIYVAVEPLTQNQRTGASFTANDWLSIITETCNYVKSISPNTQTGAMLLQTSSLDFSVYERIKNLNNLDIIGFNIYGDGPFYDEYTGSVCTGDCVGTRMNEIQLNRKKAIINETWTGVESTGILGSLWTEDSDAKWIKMITYYAQKNKSYMIMPFFTLYFIDYYPYTYPPTQEFFINLLNFLTNSLQLGKRSKVFYAYRDMINEVRANTCPTSICSFAII